jgi:hypothetical protein
MCCIATKYVPRLLTNDQKQWRVNLCLELQEKANKNPTFISISGIMGDESWIYNYDPETTTKSKKGAAGPEFNKEHAHCFFFQHEGDCSL